MKKFLVVIVVLTCSATAEAGFMCGRPVSPPCYYQPPCYYPAIIIDCPLKPEKLKFEILEGGSGGSILPGAFGFSDMPPTGHPVSFLEPTGGLRHFYILDDEDRYAFWFGWGRKWFWRNLTYCDAPPIWCSEHPSTCHKVAAGNRSPPGASGRYSKLTRLALRRNAATLGQHCLTKLFV